MKYWKLTLWIVAVVLLIPVFGLTAYVPEYQFGASTGMSVSTVHNTNGTQTITYTNTSPNTVSSVTGTSGVSCSPTTGAVSCSNTGVTSNVAGTGITVSGATGAVTVSLSTPVNTTNGGSGVSAPTAHALPVMNGAGPFSMLTPSATVGVPVVSAGTGVDPVYGTTVPAGGGTGLTTLTAHGLMVGEGTSNVATVAPNAAFGVPLISQGSSGDPIYGTCFVTSGCTGQTSFTGHSVLLGNSTGSLNSTAAGTTGQLLTGVTGADPTWQAAAAATTNSVFNEVSSAAGGTSVGNSATVVVHNTITVASGQVLLIRAGLECLTSLSGQEFQFSIGIDATSGTSANHVMGGFTTPASQAVAGAIMYRASGLSAASHTVNLAAQGISVHAGDSCGGTIMSEAVSN